MRYVLVLAAVASLAACSADNQSSKRDLSKAINEYNRNHPVCVPVSDALSEQAGDTAHLIQGRLGDAWVHITTENLNGDDINKVVQKQMKVLTRAGLYDKASRKEQQAVLGSNSLAPVDSFQLTQKGQQAFRSSPHGNWMCVGNVKVDKISWFTQPTPANGMTVTQVRFKPEFKLQDFAKKLLQQDFPNLKQQLNDEQEMGATLVQTNDGWRDIRELAAPSAKQQ